jgi:hypothetical protein
MTTLSLRLPASVHRKLGEVAAREGVSMNQFISTAVAEKLAALLAEEVLEERARRGSVERAKAALSRSPDAPPIPGDELPDAWAGSATRRSER